MMGTTAVKINGDPISDFLYRLMQESYFFTLVGSVWLFQPIGNRFYIREQEFISYETVVVISQKRPVAAPRGGNGGN